MYFNKLIIQVWVKLCDINKKIVNTIKSPREIIVIERNYNIKFVFSNSLLNSESLCHEYVFELNISINWTETK